MSAIDYQSCPALALGVRIQKDAVSGEPVLLFPEGVLFLNATAREIVVRCNGQFTVEAIVSGLAAEYDVAGETLRGDVLECLTQLHERKLIAFPR